MNMSIRITGALVALLAIVSLPQTAHAQEYPTRSITVVVPFPAGGASDIVARIVTEHMGRTLGQTLVIENVGGAGGTIGSARVAAATPDGYILLAASMGSHVAAPVLTPNIRYDAVADFVPIGVTANSPAVIAARKDIPANNFQEFVAYIRANGDKVKQAHGGVGASSHMSCMMFNLASGATPNSVAYRGSNPAMNDVIGGHVDFMCEQAVLVAEQIKSGQLKGFVVSAPERLAVLPDVPSAKELGIDYDVNIWAGMFAPKGTPPAIVEKLAAALDKALDDPSVAKRLGDLGASIPPKEQRSPAAFGKVVTAEIARWHPILKAMNKN